MTVVRLELNVPDEPQAADLANALMQEYVFPAQASGGWMSARVTVLTDFEAERERSLLTTAQYFYPPGPGERHGR